MEISYVNQKGSGYVIGRGETGSDKMSKKNSIKS
jgi:hypothetical protein